MKRIITAIVLGILLLVLATPVLASDPTGMDVDVAVVTPGDVDLDVDIDAGGDVGVTIDGTSYPEAIGVAINDAWYGGGRSPIDKIDWYRYWNTEIEPYYNLLVNHDSFLGILAEAQAKLIQEEELTQSDIDTLMDAIDGLKTRDAEIWKQLMYGAEAHIDILTIQMEERVQEIDRLESALVLANANHANLINKMETQAEQFLIYLLVMGGSVLVLAVSLLIYVHKKI